MNHRLVLALTGAIAVAGLTGCGASTTVASTPAASSTSAPTRATAGPSGCERLHGTSDPDGTCHVHSETDTYVIDFRFPTSYPDMDTVTEHIARRRDQFVDWLNRHPAPGGPRSELDIIGNTYSSPGTQSLVLTDNTGGGVHSEKEFKAFNFDVAKHVPISFDTLFKPGARLQDVLNPIVQRELDRYQVAEVSKVSAADVGIEAYQHFALTDDSVKFFLDQDDAFPHFVGALEITAPRSELAPFMAGSDPAPPCASGQVNVTVEQPQAAVTHRAVTLTFGLTPGAGPCTVTGYPGVDSGAGGPLLHADRLPRGYMGGLPGGVDEPPTVTLSPSVSAHAVVESLAVDKDGNQCPTYSELRVTPPNTTETSTVATKIDGCVLIVHPVT